VAPGGPQKGHFEHCRALAAKWPQEAPRRLILSIFGSWPPNGARRPPEGSFWAFSGLGRGHGQKWPQKAHLEHFRALAPEVGRSGPQQVNFDHFYGVFGNFRLGVWLGFEVLGLGFEILGLGFKVLGLGFEVLGLGFEVLDILKLILTISRPSPWKYSKRASWDPFLLYLGPGHKNAQNKRNLPVLTASKKSLSQIQKEFISKGNRKRNRIAWKSIKNSEKEARIS